MSDLPHRGTILSYWENNWPWAPTGWPRLPVRYACRAIYSTDAEMRVIVADIIAVAGFGYYQTTLRINKNFSLAEYCMARSFDNMEDAKAWADEQLEKYGFILITEKQAAFA